MAKFREKISSFMFGMTVGLLIGCAIFIFKIDEYIKNFRFSGNRPQFEERISVNEIEEEKVIKPKKNVAVKERKALQSQSQTSEVLSDSTSNGTNTNFVGVGVADESISVLKEELVAVKNIRVKTEADNRVNKKDTLAASVAGVTEQASGDFMMIEFWKTPLNSKGYRMTRNKVVLYGLPEQELDIVKIDDALYLRNNNSVYRLNYTNEFRKMEKVSESAILARLN